MATIPTLDSLSGSTQEIPTLDSLTTEEIPTLESFITEEDEEEEKEDKVIEGITLDSLSEGNQTIQESEDPNSFTNILLNAKDSTERNIYKSLSLFSDDLAKVNPTLGERLKNFSDKGIERNLEQLRSRPAATRDVKIVELFPEVKEDFNKGDYFEAVKKIGVLAKDSIATGIGSSIPIAISGTVAGATAALVGLPVKTTLFLSTLVPGALAEKAGFYDEAKALGASEEKAREYSNYGGLIMGLLDRVVPAAVLNSVIFKKGKKEAIQIIQKKVTEEVAEKVGKETAEEVGKEIAETAVENAVKYKAPSVLGKAVKDSFKFGLAEAATEGLQEATLISGAGLAADLGVTPYEGSVIRDRIINNAAIGWFTGRAVGLGSGALSGMSDSNAAARAQQLEDDINEAIPSLKNFKPEDLVNPLSKENKDSSIKTSGIDTFFRRSTAPLRNFASRGERQQRIYNKFINYYNDVSAEVGTKSDKIEKAINKIRRSVKLPIIMRDFSKKQNKELYEFLAKGKVSKNERVNEAGRILRADFYGEILSPEIKISRDSLIKAVVDNQPSLPELDTALRENRISEPKFKRLEKAFTDLKSKYSSNINEQSRKFTVETNEFGYRTFKFDKTFAEQESAKDILNMETDPNFKVLADKVIAPFIGTGYIQDFANAGIDIGRKENYFPRIFKTRTRGDRRRFKKVLQKFGFSEVAADSTIDNIQGNGGLYIPEDQTIVINPFETGDPLLDNKAGFEKERKINDAVFEALLDAGLVETNVAKITDKYNVEAVTRLKAKELADTVNAELKELGPQGIQQGELQLMKDIFNAIQHQYSPIRSDTLKSAQRNFLTYQYMLTLPLSALTALTEPLIVLSRVGPTNALYGTLKATENASRQAFRSFFPKIPLSRSEEAAKSILQLYDGALAERLGNISGIDVNRRITDRFFRLIMLTQITQFSRDIAFQSGLRQTRQDMLDVIQGNSAGRLNESQRKAKKRLLEIGLVEQNFNNPEVVNWLEGPIGGKPPLIIRKAMSKLVDEVIMAPNVINRPLWMSNPHYAMFAQLKGFMFAFGNTVGMRMWREVFKPLFKGRLNLQETAKYAIAFFLIVAGSLGIKDMKDYIRYGDSDSSWKESTGFSRIIQAIIDSNLFGPGTVIYDALLSFKYGAAPVGVLLGPGVQWLNNLLTAVGQFLFGSPRALARFVGNATLPSSIVSGDFKASYVDAIEEKIEPLADKLLDIRESLQ